MPPIANSVIKQQYLNYKLKTNFKTIITLKSVVSKKSTFS